MWSCTTYFFCTDKRTRLRPLFKDPISDVTVNGVLQECGLAWTRLLERLSVLLWSFDWNFKEVDDGDWMDFLPLILP